jgi:uncharacterized membrane protein YgdD (TMEM256/DUF423 family)
VNVVVLLIAALQAVQDLEGVLGARLADVDRLEPALEGGVLLDVLAVLLGRGGTNDLNLTTRERRLQDGGRVDGALGRTSANDGVDLVDEEDVVGVVLKLCDNLLHALLELAAILGSRHERRHVERPDLLATQDVGHVTGRDELRQPLDDGRLTHARVTQNERVVLLPAREHLHDALNLAVTVEHRVKLAGLGELGEVAAVLLEHGAVIRGRLATHAHEGAGVHADLGGGLALLLGVLGDKLVHRVAHRVSRDAHGAQGVHGATVALGHDAQKQVLGGNVGLAMRHGLAIGCLEHALGARREGNVTAGNGLGLVLGELLYRGECLVVCNVKLCERLSRNAVPLLDEGQEQVLRAHVHLAETSRLVLCQAHDLPGPVSEFLEHTLTSPQCHAGRQETRGPEGPRAGLRAPRCLLGSLFTHARERANTRTKRTLLLGMALEPLLAVRRDGAHGLDHACEQVI